MAALAGGQAQEPVRADGDLLGSAFTAAGGTQHRADAPSLAGRDGQLVTGGHLLGSGHPTARRPGIAEPRSQRAAGGIDYGELHFCLPPSRTDVSPDRVN